MRLSASECVWLDCACHAQCTFSYALGDTTSVANRVGIGYLKSYEHMGSVRVDCMHQCACEPLVIDAHNLERISPLDLVYFSVRIQQHDLDLDLDPVRIQQPPPTAEALRESTRRRCGVRLTVLNATSSGHHKFKLTALFVNR